MANKFTPDKARRYLTAKTRGAKSTGKDLIYTPEFTEYVSKHTTQQDLKEALEVRAQSVYNKGLPKAPKNMSKLARLEYKQVQKEAKTAKAELARVLYDDNQTRNNMRLMRRLSSYENYRQALRNESTFYEDQSLGRLVGILGNTFEFNYNKVSKEDMSKMLNHIERLKINLNDFYKAYDIMISAHYGSDDLAKELLNIGDSVENMLENGKFKGNMKEEATQLVDIMERYGLV